MAQKAVAFVQDHQEPAGKLRIGTAESLSISVLPAILLEFTRRCPRVETSIHTGLIPDLFHMVRQNDVDLLYFLDKRTYFPEWVKVFERPEPIVFVASSSHPFVGQGKLSLKKLLTQPLVLTEQGISYRYDLEQILAAKNLELHPYLETGNTDLVVQMLLQHTGISFLPRYVVQRYLEAGQLSTLQVDCPKIQMWSQLVYHKNKWVTPQMQVFIDLLRQTVGPSLRGHRKSPIHSTHSMGGGFSFEKTAVLFSSDGQICSILLQTSPIFKLFVRLSVVLPPPHCIECRKTVPFFSEKHH